MANLFGVDMRALLASAMGSQLYDATLVKVTPGSYDASDPSAGNASTTTSYACKGTPTKIVSEFVAEDQTRRITGEVLVLLGSLPSGIEPLVGDTITIYRPGNGDTVTGTVVSAKVDPAGASCVANVRA